MEVPIGEEQSTLMYYRDSLNQHHVLVVLYNNWQMLGRMRQTNRMVILVRDNILRLNPENQLEAVRYLFQYGQKCILCLFSEFLYLEGIMFI